MAQSVFYSLYNSDVLMFDRQTKSLWSQLGLASISGEYAGTELEWLPSEQTTWLEDHVGETEVRVRYSPDTGKFEALSAAGEPLPVVHAFWFAWQAFYPESDVRK